MTGLRSCVLLRFGVVAAGALLFGAMEAEAQVIGGTVVDSESGEPVVLAYVGLLEPGAGLVVVTLASRDGTFSLRAPWAGNYLLYVERAGYSPLLDGLYELGEGGVLDVTVGLRVAPVALERMVVDVEGRRRDLRAVGFEERRARGLGHFVDRERIERSAVDKVTDALRGIPGLVVTTPRPSPIAPTGVLNPEVLIGTGVERCSPSLYVDGHLVTPGGVRRSEAWAVRPDDFVDPADVEAIELYTSPAEVPVEYETGSGCGVVLVWTR